MDPTALATVAVTALSPYLLEAGKAGAGALGKEAFAQLKSLVTWLRQRLASDSYASETLKRLSDEPEDEDRQQQLASVLSGIAKKDSAFAAELRGLVDALPAPPPRAKYHVENKGPVTVQQVGDSNTQTNHFGEAVSKKG